MIVATLDEETRSREAGILEVLIVDDEDLARQRIRDLLALEPGLRVCGECRNGLEAVESIRSLEPDIVFLDISMPELDGFGVIERVGRERMPVVIFVTAFDEHAVRAFEASAVDYLLKPFDRGRFDQALGRALSHFRRDALGDLERRLERLFALTEARREEQAKPFADRLVVRHGGTVHLLKVDEVDWIESARNYVKIHCGDEVFTLRETLTNIESRLDSDRFLRIHRSTLVNVDRIRRIEPGYGTESRLELEDGTRLVISRAYRRGKVRELLGILE
ncbi:MAG: LytTR family DNA-binding domain-containing protein [Acidobacteriota bacterium]